MRVDSYLRLEMEGVLIINAIAALEEAEIAADNIQERFRTYISYFVQITNTLL